MGIKGKALAHAVDDGLRRAGLTERGHDTLVDLSGGMQRRLNIVAGTLHQPQLLLLDEPTVGVDLTAREAIHALLHDLRDSGMGMLLTTHDFDQAASVADRVAFMLDGRILVEGTVAELVNRVFAGAKELVVSLDRPAAAVRTLVPECEFLGDFLTSEAVAVYFKDGCPTGAVNHGNDACCVS